MPIYARRARRSTRSARTFDYVVRRRTRRRAAACRTCGCGRSAARSVVGRQEIVPVPIRHGPLGHSRVSVRALRVPHRLQRRAGRRRWRCSAGSTARARRAAAPAASDAFHARPRPIGDGAARLARARRYFTHIAHDLGHAATCAALPAGMALAHDGLDRVESRLMQVVYFPGSPPPPSGRARSSRSATSTGCIAGTRSSSTRCGAQARERGGTSVAMIFDPHPPRVLRPDKAPPLLMTLDQKLEAFERAGLERVAIVRFTHELSRWEPETFVETVLIDWLRRRRGLGRRELPVRPRSIRHVHAAAGARRGPRVPRRRRSSRSATRTSSSRARASGTWWPRDGSTRPGRCSGITTSSTARSCTATAAAASSGFPTANLRDGQRAPARRTASMRRSACVDGRAHRAVTSIGVRPTIGDGPVTVETHLLDGDHDLYGAAPASRVRQVAARRSASSTASTRSRAQIARDCADAASVLARISVSRVRVRVPRRRALLESCDHADARRVHACIVPADAAVPSRWRPTSRPTSIRASVRRADVGCAATLARGADGARRRRRRDLERSRVRRGGRGHRSGVPAERRRASHVDHPLRRPKPRRHVTAAGRAASADRRAVVSACVSTTP